MSEMNGRVRPESSDEPVATQEMVGIEVVPVGRTEGRCEGAVIRLVSGEGESEKTLAAAGLSPEQCREIARRLLMTADLASGNTECTVMCVSARSMWALPGQVLLVRQTEDGAANFEFAVDPKKMQVVRPRRQLILPGRG